jgi:hypothetical protein
MVILGRSDLTLPDTTKGNGVDISVLAEDIKKAARTVSFQWPTVVDADDLEQDIYVHLLERKGSLEKLLTEFDGRNRLNAIIAIGHQIASQERDAYDIFSGNFRYSVDEVRRILEERALHDEDPSLGSNWTISDDYISKGGEFEDAVLNRSSCEIDLLRGFGRLLKQNSKYAEIIRRRYLLSESFSDGADRKQLNRALTALTSEMNRSFKQQQREHDGPGSRKPVSAAAAHYKSKANWDDESSEAVERLMAQAKVSARK